MACGRKYYKSSNNVIVLTKWILYVATCFFINAVMKCPKQNHQLAVLNQYFFLLILLLYF